VVAASRVSEENVVRLLQALLSRFDLVLADLTPALDSVACLPVLEMADLTVLITGPDLASRFHTRRHLLPTGAMGLQGRCRLVLNRTDGADIRRIGLELGLDPAAVVPDAKVITGLAEAGQIAYFSQAPHPGLARFRAAVEQLAALVLQGG
jgi:Flp pilus assembly CpaE family ATPase